MKIEKNMRVFTPRFLNVRIAEIFDSVAAAYDAGFKEPTHFTDPDREYTVLGKSLDMYSMIFAAAKL